jgi:hypothetical protein
MNTGGDRFNPIFEILFLDHLGFYRTAAPSHSGITTLRADDRGAQSGQRPTF